MQSRAVIPGRRERDLDERAAIEAIHDGIHLMGDERTILMAEADLVLRRVLVFEAEVIARIIPMTTRDFLAGMEVAHRINSVAEV